MRLTDFTFIKDLVNEYADQGKMSRECADEITEKFKARYDEQLAIEVARQRAIRLRKRDTIIDTADGKMVREMNVNDWIVIPPEKRNSLRAVKNALNKSEIYGRYETHRLPTIGVVLTRVE